MSSLWTDVVFDHPAAEAAADECARMAAALSDGIQARVAAAETARTGWTGMYVQEFDDELADFVAHTTHVIESLLHQVGRILEAAEEARVEQARIEVAREEFRAEVRARAARERLARLDAGAGVNVHE